MDVDLTLIYSHYYELARDAGCVANREVHALAIVSVVRQAAVGAPGSVAQTELASRAEAAVVGVAPRLVLARVARRALALASPCLAVAEGGWAKAKTATPHERLFVSTSTLSPLIPPQPVRRSPSPQVPHAMHLSGGTCAQVRHLRRSGTWNRGRRAAAAVAGVWGSLAQKPYYSELLYCSQFQLSDRSGPHWCCPCSSPLHTACNCLWRRACGSQKAN